MVVGLILFSSVAAALVSGLGLALGMPIWAVLVAYPFIGSLTLLSSAAMVYSREAHAQHDDQSQHEDLATV
ncbi:hypothetical protein [Celeribacter baekdonensis]|uniref:Uncharacterized protein n=1 Tax=Celeribacter baekdonensis TaxID=875171 RepID=A0A2R4M739_9RHOB|nr:hypothetical protein [Celeribacter baekdonensis]AVW93020.1 hypothetical protein DA792_19625 [Celeribacter baekdonensis]